MDIILNIWLSFNVVFGLWSSRNWYNWVIAKFSFGKYKYNQSMAGKTLDLFILANILAYYLTVKG